MAERDTRFDVGIRRLADKITIPSGDGESVAEEYYRIAETLRRELGPLLEKAHETCDSHCLNPCTTTCSVGYLRKELSKWQK